jgi:hypothetical protein
MDSPDHGTIKRRLDLDDVALFDPSTIDEQTMGCDMGHGHLSHGSLLNARARSRDYRPRRFTQLEPC